MRRAFEPVLDHAADLRQLLHEVGLRVQAAGRVDDDDVVAARRRGFDRVVGDSSWVAAALGADEVRLRAVGPDLELLLGGGAEGVRGGDDHRAAVLVQVVRELPDRRRLARAVDADDEEHARLLTNGERARLAEHGRSLLDECLGQISDLAAGLEPRDELGGGRHADVGGDQRLLEPLPGLVVGGIEGGGGELVGERAAALARANPAGARRSPAPAACSSSRSSSSPSRARSTWSWRDDIRGGRLCGDVFARGAAARRSPRRRRRPSSRRRGRRRPPSSASGA